MPSENLFSEWSRIAKRGGKDMFISAVAVAEHSLAVLFDNVH